MWMPILTLTGEPAAIRVPGALPAWRSPPAPPAEPTRSREEGIAFGLDRDAAVHVDGGAEDAVVVLQHLPPFIGGQVLDEASIPRCRSGGTWTVPERDGAILSIQPPRFGATPPRPEIPSVRRTPWRTVSPAAASSAASTKGNGDELRTATRALPVSDVDAASVLHRRQGSSSTSIMPSATPFGWCSALLRGQPARWHSASVSPTPNQDRSWDCTWW